MEADFLKTLSETRMLEHAFGRVLERMEGDPGSGPETRQGFKALQNSVYGLKDSVSSLCSSLDKERRRFTQLHAGWRVCKVLAGYQSVV
jgi:hypothetical protein